MKKTNDKAGASRTSSAAESSSVVHFMTSSPRTVRPATTLASARTLMNDLGMRHLPVTSDDGTVVGILAERDLYQLTALHDLDFNTTAVSIAMVPEPFCVAATDCVADVAAVLTRRKISSALVVDESNHLLGIFTEADALRILSQARAQPLISHSMHREQKH